MKKTNTSDILCGEPSGIEVTERSRIIIVAVRMLQATRSKKVKVFERVCQT